MLRFSGAGVSDVGRVRPHNEDSAFHGPYVAVVADGVGGAAAGEVASATAAYVVAATALARFGDDPVEVLVRAASRTRTRACVRPASARTTSSAGHGDHPDRRGHRRAAGRARPRRRQPRLPAARRRAAPDLARTTPTSSTWSTPASSTPSERVRPPVEQHRAALARRRAGPGRFDVAESRRPSGRPAAAVQRRPDRPGHRRPDRRGAPARRPALRRPRCSTQSALLAGGRDNITAVVLDVVEGPLVVGDGRLLGAAWPTSRNVVDPAAGPRRHS